MTKLKMYLYIYAVTRVWARPIVTWIESITVAFRLTCAVRIAVVITVVATPSSLRHCVSFVLGGQWSWLQWWHAIPCRESRIVYTYIDGTSVWSNDKLNCFVASFLCFDVKYFTYTETHCRLGYHVQQQHQLKIEKQVPKRMYEDVADKFMQRKTKIKKLGQLCLFLNGT